MVPAALPQKTLRKPAESKVRPTVRSAACSRRSESPLCSRSPPARRPRRPTPTRPSAVTPSSTASRSASARSRSAAAGRPPRSGGTRRAGPATTRAAEADPMAITNIDEGKLEAFIGLAATELGAALNTALVTLGDELGLYRAMADSQPVTPAQLAARTGTLERYVREWLNAQAASGFVIHDDGAYVLPPEHALVLADETSPFLMLGSFQAANAAVVARESMAERF